MPHEQEGRGPGCALQNLVGQNRAQADLREEVEEDLEQKARELQQSSTYKSEFLANMSHEIRTPLNTILGISDLMSGEKPCDEWIDNIQLINNSGNHLLGILNDILDFSKLGREQLDLVSETFNLEELNLGDLPINKDPLHFAPIFNIN